MGGVSGEPPLGAAAVGEEWGYAEVREGAHMFWWLFEHTPVPGLGGEEGVGGVWRPAGGAAPLVLWLQGGPGASGTGFGNFEEVGPYAPLLDREGAWVRREFSWTREAHVLFVDNPVGAGFSYVEGGDEGLLARDNVQVAGDLVELLRAFYMRRPDLAASPLHIWCESYGGKMGAGLANALLDWQAEQPPGGPLEPLQGVVLETVALGDSWISPTDSTEAWADLAFQAALVDGRGRDKVAAAAAASTTAVEAGRWEEATRRWAQAEEALADATDGADLYNFLLHHQGDDDDTAKGAAAGDGDEGALKRAGRRVLGRHGGTMLESPSSGGRLGAWMDGEVRAHLKGAVPDAVRWGSQSEAVFAALSEDFMKSAVPDVERLLSRTDVSHVPFFKVVVYSGQLDIICCHSGAERWLQRLEWEGKESFAAAPREAVYAPGADAQSGRTGGFRKRWGRLEVWQVMSAGHMVPADNPSAALEMLRRVLHDTWES